MENIKLLFALYYRPHSVMSDIIDKGSWFAAAALMLVVSFAFQYFVNARIAETYAVSKWDYYMSNSSFDDESTMTDGRLTAQQLEEAEYLAHADIEREMRREHRPLPVVGKYGLWFFSFESNFFVPLLSLSIFYVPLVILLAVVFGQIGRFGLIVQRDYGMLATCSLMAWAAAHLPFAIAGILLYAQPVDGSVFLALWAASGVLFGVLMIFAIRTVLGTSYAVAVLTVCLSWLGFSLGMYVFRLVSPWIFSPFIGVYVILYLGGYLRGEVTGLSNSFRQRQNFKRFLHNATVNPRDADAHVQLGLIYLERRQEAKALEHLNRAIEIDPGEPDASYELGKIARQKGNLQEALNHFSTVVEQNDKHAVSEIWREIGATYLAANMLAEAREALEKYVERRSADAEGLYHLGKVLKAQGETERAREMFQQAIDSAQASPDYRRRELRYWSKLAQKEI
jgi:Tfp pilus assembly protein PilF